MFFKKKLCNKFFLNQNYNSNIFIIIITIINENWIRNFKNVYVENLYNKQIFFKHSIIRVLSF